MQKILLSVSLIISIGVFGLMAVPTATATTLNTTTDSTTKSAATKISDTNTKAVTTNPENTTTVTATTVVGSKTSTPTSADVDAAKKKADDALALYRSAKAADKLAQLMAYGDHAIDQRVAELQKFEASAMKGLSEAQIAAIKTKVDKNITDLQALKVKIDAATTVDAEKTLVQSIYADFRIYALFMPDMNLTVAAEQMEAMVTKLSALSARMQKAIDAATGAGKDTTALSAALKDFNAQLADATVNITASKTELAKIDITQLEASKTARISARTNLTQARANLVAARGDLKSFSDALVVKATTANSTAGSTQSTTNTTTNPSATSPTNTTH